MAYNQNEPRDKSGKWTAGAVASSNNKTKETKSVQKYNIHLKSVIKGKKPVSTAYLKKSAIKGVNDFFKNVKKKEKEMKKK